ncbi:MAG: cupin domain-containing protein, partial [Armatimonadota bacterium]
MRGEAICRSLEQVAPVACPCGSSRRILSVADGVTVGFHVTQMRDAVAHYHQRTAQTYYVLAGSGRLTIAGSAWDVRPGSVAHIPPGCVHRGEGSFTAAIATLPPFDPSDEFTAGEQLPRPCRGPIVRHRDEIEPVRSLCGTSRRVLTRADGVAMGLHVVHIRRAECHYHERTTEVYHILQGEGTLAVGSERFALAPAVTVYVPPGLTHAGHGDFTAI